MADVAERVTAAEQRIGRWRRRTVLLVVAGIAVVAAGAAWSMTRETGPWIPPLEQGGGAGAMHCQGARSREVPDTFGGGGEIVDYVDGARCEAVLSITNPTQEPVKVLSVERTAKSRIEPIRLVSATRAKRPLSAASRCYGCAEKFVDFSPMTLAPGGEWEIAVQGVMRNCRAPKRGGSYSTQARESLAFQVEVDGEKRPVTVFLELPWAVRFDGCSSRY